MPAVWAPIIIVTEKFKNAKKIYIDFSMTDSPVSVILSSLVSVRLSVKYKANVYSFWTYNIEHMRGGVSLYCSAIT